MASFVKQRDYAGLMPNYQALGQRQGEIYGGGLQDLMKVLGEILQNNRQRAEFENVNPSFDSFTKGSNVNTDLLNRPIAPVRTPDISESGMQFNPMQNAMLAAKGNPFAARAQDTYQKSWENVAEGGLHKNTMTGETIDGRPKRIADKRIGQGTVNGRLIATMQKPDGSTYPIDLGESFEGERLKALKGNIDLARKRFESAQNKELKSEGRYLIGQYDRAEKEYNRNMLYLSDPNLPDSMRQTIQQQQVELLNEMNAYGQDINSLGATPTQVITAPTQPKNNPIKQNDGGKIRVRRKSDGKTGTIDAKDFNAGKYDRI